MQNLLRLRFGTLIWLLSILLLLVTTSLSYQWYLSRDSKVSSKLLAEVYQKGMYAADRPILSFSQKIFYSKMADLQMPIEYVYKFTNIGRKDLIIHQVQGGCCSDCVTIQWPKKPIQVGEHGEIKVRLNKLDQGKEQTYTIVVRANTDPAETRLVLIGT